MRMFTWLVPLSGAFLLAGAFALQADAPQTAGPQWAQATALPAERVAPAHGGTEEGLVLPILNDTWWKLKVSCKGYTVHNLSGATEKETLKFTAYMQLLANKFDVGDGGGGGFPLYTYSMWLEDSDGIWLPSYSNTLYVTGTSDEGDETLSVNSFIGFIRSSFQVASSHSGRFTIKKDSEGVLKSAKFKTIGSELIDSVIVPEVILLGDPVMLDLYGEMTISGSTVDVEKLPFNPEI
jgi:hypothetical protein